VTHRVQNVPTRAQGRYKIPIFTRAMYPPSLAWSQVPASSRNHVLLSLPGEEVCKSNLPGHSIRCVDGGKNTYKNMSSTRCTRRSPRYESIIGTARAATRSEFFAPRDANGYTGCYIVNGYIPYLRTAYCVLKRYSLLHLMYLVVRPRPSHRHDQPPRNPHPAFDSVNWPGSLGKLFPGD